MYQVYFIFHILLMIFLYQVTPQIAQARSEIAPPTKIYFVSARLDKIKDVLIPGQNKTVILLSLTKMGPGQSDGRANTDREVVVPYAPNPCNQLYYVVEEQNGDKQILNQLKGSIVNSVPLEETKTTTCPKWQLIHSSFSIKVKQQTRSLLLYAPNPPYLQIDNACFGLPACTKDDKPLTVIKTFFDFFGVKGQYGWLKHGENEHVEYMVEQLGSIPSYAALELAFAYQVDGQAFWSTTHKFWRSKILQLPGIFNYLKSKYPAALSFHEMVKLISDVSFDQALVFFQEEIKKAAPIDKANKLLYLVQELRYPVVYRYVFQEYNKLDFATQVTFLDSYAHTILTDGCDELTKEFMIRERDKLKNAKLASSDQAHIEKTLESVNQVLALLEQREQKKLYDWKYFIPYYEQHQYDDKFNTLLKGMRFIGQGEIQYNLGSEITVISKTQVGPVFYKLQLTMDQEKRFNKLRSGDKIAFERKPGDKIAFEGTLVQLSHYDLEHHVMIELDHIVIRE